MVQLSNYTTEHKAVNTQPLVVNYFKHGSHGIISKFANWLPTAAFACPSGSKLVKFRQLKIIRHIS